MMRDAAEKIKTLTKDQATKDEVKKQPNEVPCNDDKNSRIDLEKLALTAELLFMVMFSLEVVVKEIALFGYVGLILGVFYSIIQTYACCFNYWLDCFYKNGYFTEKQKKVLTPVTLFCGFISAVFLFLTSFSNGWILYKLTFLERLFSHCVSAHRAHLIITGIVFTLSFIAAFIYFTGALSHISYNLKKLRTRSKNDTVKSDSNNNKPSTWLNNWFEKSGQIFFSTTKIRWGISVINFGFLLQASFDWHAFIIGALLTVLYIYDESFFLLYCQDADCKKYSPKGLFKLTCKYTIASVFSVSYSAFLVYANLNYFCNLFSPTPKWLNFVFSVCTAIVGMIAGAARKVKVYEGLKAKYQASEETFSAETYGVAIIAT